MTEKDIMMERLATVLINFSNTWGRNQYDLLKSLRENKFITDEEFKNLGYKPYWEEENDEWLAEEHSGSEGDEG